MNSSIAGQSFSLGRTAAAVAVLSLALVSRADALTGTGALEAAGRPGLSVHPVQMLPQAPGGAPFAPIPRIEGPAYAAPGVGSLDDPASAKLYMPNTMELTIRQAPGDGGGDTERTTPQPPPVTRREEPQPPPVTRREEPQPRSEPPQPPPPVNVTGLWGCKVSAPTLVQRYQQMGMRYSIGRFFVVFRPDGGYESRVEYRIASQYMDSGWMVMAEWGTYQVNGPSIAFEVAGRHPAQSGAASPSYSALLTVRENGIILVVNDGMSQTTMNCQRAQQRS